MEPTQLRSPKYTVNTAEIYGRRFPAGYWKLIRGGFYANISGTQAGAQARHISRVLSAHFQFLLTGLAFGKGRGVGCWVVTVKQNHANAGKGA